MYAPFSHFQIASDVISAIFLFFLIFIFIDWIVILTESNSVFFVLVQQ